MYHSLNTLYLKDFRNYRRACFEFSPSINAIVGKNAQGKTNLLEAIHVLISGRSFRTSSLNELPFFDAPLFYLEAYFEKSGVAQALKMTYQENKRKIILNHTPLPTLSSLFGILLGVTLTPEDGALITGPPHLRRQLLNLHIAQTDPLYVHHFKRYEKALKQRNTLLKQKSIYSIEAWEEQMAISGIYLVQQRENEIQQIEKKAQEVLNFLSFEQEMLTLKYKPSINSKEIFQSKLAKFREKEIALGYTTIGPHKDEVAILLNDTEAVSFASEGQKRGIVTSLRLAQWHLLKEKTEQIPLFCIDDVGIFLDPEREEKLFSLLPKLGQVFLTSPRHLPQLSCRIFNIETNQTGNQSFDFSVPFLGDHSMDDKLSNIRS